MMKLEQESVLGGTVFNIGEIFMILGTGGILG